MEAPESSVVGVGTGLNKESLERVASLEIIDEESCSTFFTSLLDVLSAKPDEMQVGGGISTMLLYEHPWIISRLQKIMIDLPKTSAKDFSKLLECLITRYKSRSPVIIIAYFSVMKDVSPTEKYASLIRFTIDLLSSSEKNMMIDYVVSFDTEIPHEQIHILRTFDAVSQAETEDVKKALEKLGFVRFLRRANQVLCKLGARKTDIAHQDYKDFFTSSVRLKLTHAALKILCDVDELGKESFPLHFYMFWFRSTEDHLIPSTSNIYPFVIDTLRKIAFSLIEEGLETDQDFSKICKASTSLLSIISSFSTRMTLNSNNELWEVISVICAFSHIHGQDGVYLSGSEWISPALSKLSQSALLLIATRHGFKSTEEMIGIHMNFVLSSIKPNLEKEGRVNEPAAHSICWVLSNVKRPHFGPAIDNVVEVLDKAIASTTMSTKIKAALALRNVFDEANPTELRWHKTLLIQVLQKELYFREPEYLCITLPLAIQSLPTLEGNPDGPYHSSTYEQIIRDMDLYVTKVVEMKIYSKELPKLFMSMNINMVSRLKILIEIFDRFLETGDLELSNYVLLALVETFKICWMRIPAYKRKIMSFCVRALSDIDSPVLKPSPGQKEAAKETLIHAMSLLRCICENEWDQLCQEHIIRNPAIISFLNSIPNIPTRGFEHTQSHSIR